MLKKTILVILSLFVACSLLSSNASAINDMQDAPQTKYKEDKIKEEVEQKKKEQKKKETTYKAKMDKQGGVDLKSTKYPYKQYRPVAYIDGGWNPASTENLMKGVNAIADISFKLNLFISEKVDYFLSTWFNVQIIDKLIQPISELSQSIFNPMKADLIPFLFTISLVFAVGFFAMGRVGKSLGVILKGGFIFGLALAWFSSQVYLTNFMNDISEDGQSLFMSANEPLSNKHMEQGNEKQSTIAHIRNYYFETTVEKPYLLMNYGSTSKEEINKKQDDRVDKLLQVKQNKDGNKKREEIAKKEVSDLKNENMNSDSPGNKLVMSLSTTGMNLLVSIPLLAVALFDMFLQIMIPLTMLFLPIVFALSMLPQLTQSIGKAFANIGLLFFLKMLVGILVTLTFTVITIANMITPIESEGSYVGNLLLTILLYFLIFKFRNQLISIVSGGTVETKGKQRGRPGQNNQRVNPKQMLQKAKHDRMQKQNSKQREISKINNDLRQSEQVSTPQQRQDAQKTASEFASKNGAKSNNQNKASDPNNKQGKKSVIKDMFNKKKQTKDSNNSQSVPNQEEQPKTDNKQSTSSSNNESTNANGVKSPHIPLSAKGKQDKQQSDKPEYASYTGGSQNNENGSVPRPQRNWDDKSLNRLQKETLKNNNDIKQSNSKFGSNPEFNKAKKEYAEYRKNHNKKQTEDKFKNASSSNPYYKEGVKQARRLEKQKNNLQVLSQNKDKVYSNHKTHQSDNKRQTRVNRGDAYNNYINKGSSNA